MGETVMAMLISHLFGPFMIILAIPLLLIGMCSKKWRKDVLDVLGIMTIIIVAGFAMVGAMFYGCLRFLSSSFNLHWF
jgi:hypothetical protein